MPKKYCHLFPPTINILSRKMPAEGTLGQFKSSRFHFDDVVLLKPIQFTKSIQNCIGKTVGNTDTFLLNVLFAIAGLLFVLLLYLESIVSTRNHFVLHFRISDSSYYTVTLFGIDYFDSRQFSLHFRSSQPSYV